MPSVLDRLEALNEGATEGPWYPGTLSSYGRVVSAVPNPGRWDRQTVARTLSEPDQALIAAARNALPDLLAVAKAAQESYEFYRDRSLGEEPDMSGEVHARQMLGDELVEALAPLLRGVEA